MNNAFKFDRNFLFFNQMYVLYLEYSFLVRNKCFWNGKILLRCSCKYLKVKYQADGQTGKAVKSCLF